MTEVVVTGVGAVTPLGLGAATLHERWAAGVCGIADGEGRCREFVADRASLGQGGATRRPLHAARARRVDRGARRRRLGRGAALRPATRIGSIIGTGIGGIGTIEANDLAMFEHGPKHVSPLAVPLMMGNAAAAAVSMRHGLRGPRFGTCRRARRAPTRSARRCGRSRTATRSRSSRAAPKPR